MHNKNKRRNNSMCLLYRLGTPTWTTFQDVVPCSLQCAGSPKFLVSNVDMQPVRLGCIEGCIGMGNTIKENQQGDTWGLNEYLLFHTT